MIIRLKEEIKSVCGAYIAAKGEELEVSSYDEKLEIYNCEKVWGINSSIIYEVCKESAEVVQEQKPVGEKCEHVTYNNEKNCIELSHALDDMEPPKEWKIETKLKQENQADEIVYPSKIRMTKNLKDYEHLEIRKGDTFLPIKITDDFYFVSLLHGILEIPKEAAEVIETKTVLQDWRGAYSEQVIVDEPEQETSTGGSSKYYDMIINGQPVKAEDVIKDVFTNDFDFGNAFKALVRAHAAKYGVAKAGSPLDYNCEKLKYYADRIRK